ncbi:MAG: riboflavin kinase [Bacteroidales bacterium]
MATYDHQTFSGIVVKGLQNGRKFGFPTANLSLHEPHAQIENGVYAVQLTVQKKVYFGMLYAGTRPTLQLTQTSYEIHIFDFSDTIYNQVIEFYIIEKIRDERTFTSTSALIEQIKIDQDEIQKIIDR